RSGPACSPSRRPVRHIVGIDIGGTNIVVGTVAEDGSELVGLVSAPTISEQGAEAVIERIVKLARASMEQARGKKIAGVGIGSPGPLNTKIGHMSIDSNGRRCKCGNDGCLEAYASGPAIAARAVEGIETGADTSLPRYVNGDLSKITAQIVYEAAHDGDEYALEVVHDTAKF